MPRTAEQAAMHDARAVHDTATLRFQDYLRAGGQPEWMLARVDPASQSGNATVPGAALRNGKLVGPANAPAVIMKIGAWSRLAGEGTEADGAPYSWTENLQEEIRTPSPEDFYSPFVRGGVVLFHPDAAQGLGSFGSPRLLFPDWGSDMPAAMKLAREYAGVLDSALPDPGREAKLANLTGHRNRLIAAAAFRQWVSQPREDQSVVADRLARAKGHMASVVVFLLLTGSSDPKAVEEVRQAVAVAPGSDVLRSIALGAFAATLFRGKQPGAAEQAEAVLSAARERLGVRTIAADPYLSAIFAR